MRTLKAGLAVVASIMALGVVTPTIEEVVTSPTTFAVCKTVDVVSTIHLLSIGGFAEANPIVAWSISVGGYVPLIAVSVGLWYLLKEANNPYVTGFANIVTCAVAGSNLALIP